MHDNQQEFYICSSSQVYWCKILLQILSPQLIPAGSVKEIKQCNNTIWRLNSKFVTLDGRKENWKTEICQKRKYN